MKNFDNEDECLNLILAGFNNYEIAEQLGISIEVVKSHLQEIYKAQGVYNRVQLVVKFNKFCQ